MSAHLKIAAGALSLALASTATAQDSVSSLATSLPGDALETYSLAQNHSFKNYVVDMTAFRASWGTRFALAPLVKSTKNNAGFANALISAQAISATLLKNVPYHGSYQVWNAPGKGIHPTNNLPTALKTPVGLSRQFAVAFAEFGALTPPVGAGYNGISAAVVNYDRRNPSRLYVSRISAVTNGLNASEDRSQLGMGAVDSDGNVTFRADGFGSITPPVLTGNNILRTDLLARTPGVINRLDNTGIVEGDWLVVRSGTTYNTPTCIPEQIAGRPLFIGSNFNAQYAYEDAPLAVSLTTVHRLPVLDHRGAVHWSKHDIFGGVGTGVMLGTDALNAARILLFWGTDPDGSVRGNLAATPPATITDPFTGFVIDSSGASIHHQSQTFARGGNGQVSWGKDRDGDFLIAATMESVPGGGSINPFNGIFVAKIDGVSGAVLGWSTPAYVDAFGQKKPIVDGPGGTVLGEITELFNVTGGLVNGPSMSSPCIDSVGNIWFLSAVELFTAGPRGTPGNDFDTALIRGVYDRVAFGWELELVVQLGDVFEGRNSGTPYQITFMGIADNNSISSGTMFSHNIMQCAFDDANTAAIPERSARGLGGLVLNAEITYDKNGDSIFDDAGGVDEAYQTLLYVAPDMSPVRSGSL